MIHKNILAFILLSGATLAYGQKWVDTLYKIQQVNDIGFGKATDFGGTERTLKMDICIPQNDSLPTCGRPLMVIIHGGAFLAGDKTIDAPPRLMKEFAQRGYVTASINYRLGFFQTASEINCNISTAVPWNCLNATDSAEWERALYRGMQDAKAAIRYMVNHSAQYKIDIRNVFVVGESAGGFIALSTAFMDDASEKPASCGKVADAAKPNKIYENQCVVTPGFSSSVDSLKLARPDLGPVEGNVNLPAAGYTIRGVGSFYGGMYHDLFSVSKFVKQPVLYMFHQPNDLIVPYRYNRLFADFAYCATQFPANCQDIINRKFVMGSRGIKDLSIRLANTGKAVPSVLFDSTLNTSNCLAQVGNPSLAGHAIDNLPLRSLRMAGIFAKAMDSSANCGSSFVDPVSPMASSVKIYPNPVNASLHFEAGFDVLGIEIMDMTSKTIFISSPGVKSGNLDLSSLKSGIYLVRLQGVEAAFYKNIIIN